MEQLSRLFDLPSLGKFGIESFEEGARKILMVFFIGITLFSFPFESGEGSIFCFHCCVHNGSREHENMSSAYDDYYTRECLDTCSRSKFSRPECLKSCEIQFRGKLKLGKDTHDCLGLYGLGKEYLKDKKDQFASSECAVPEVLRQMEFFGSILVSLVCWAIIQNWWVHFSENQLRGLLNIQSVLTDEKICRSCIESFIAVNRRERCDSCLTEAKDVLPVYKPVQKDRDGLQQIPTNFMKQNIFNALVCLALMYYICPGAHFQREFQCNISSEFLKDTHLYMHPSFMRCINQSATFLRAVKYLLIILNASLFLSFIWSIFRSKDIVTRLYKGLHVN